MELYNALWVLTFLKPLVTYKDFTKSYLQSLNYFISFMNHFSNFISCAKN